MNLVQQLFPRLTGKWGTINLNDLAIHLQPLLAPLMSQPTNPFLDPKYCEKWKEFIHYVKGIDYSWGGYMEDRAVAWAGHYHEKGATMHAGVDFYVPAGSRVHCPVTAKLVHSAIDEDKNGGWGGFMVFQYEDEHFILAHLRDLRTEVGSTFGPRDEVGIVAEDDCNGGWSPHLHLQRVKSRDLDFVLSVDGYLRPYEGIMKDFPDPQELGVWDVADYGRR
jgi:hypothetical protein